MLIIHLSFVCILPVPWAIDEISSKMFLEALPGRKIARTCVTDDEKEIVLQVFSRVDDDENATTLK